MIKIRTKIKWYVASETSHPSENLIRFYRQLLELSAEYAEFYPYLTMYDFQNLMTASLSKGTLLVIF